MLSPQYQRNFYPPRVGFPGPEDLSQDTRPHATRQSLPSLLAPEAVHQTLQSLGKLISMPLIIFREG